MTERCEECELIVTLKDGLFECCCGQMWKPDPRLVVAVDQGAPGGDYSARVTAKIDGDQIEILDLDVFQPGGEDDPIGRLQILERALAEAAGDIRSLAELVRKHDHKVSFYALDAVATVLERKLRGRR